MERDDGKGRESRQVVDWHHAPLHLFVPSTIYMITGATLYKENFHRGYERLRVLEHVVLDITARRGWDLQAWSLFSNHYHIIAKAPPDTGDARRLVQHIHSEAAKAVNRLDGTPGRRVWREYWDTCLTFESSYYARLNYVMHNPVRHGLVSAARLYPFCSAGWFEQNARSSFRRRVASYKFDLVRLPDDFEPLTCPDLPNTLCTRTHPPRQG